jgi:glycosyltransferase involved in cell wall biosynthesis
MTRCPTLAELPPPPPGKSGWPWTVETPQLPSARRDGSQWPRISIVTPSYNQGQFIEETIRSVLLQGYPDLEYIIIDGGSTDASVEIIRKYQPWLAYWTSQEDAGQVAALNKGFSKVTGGYLNWLNSDDGLMPNALEAIASIALVAQDPDLISGVRLYKDVSGVLRTCEAGWIEHWPLYLAGLPYFSQEATFFSRSKWEKIGKFDERLNYGFDVAFFNLALNSSRRVALTSTPISVMHVYGTQKTNRDDPAKAVERNILINEYGPLGRRSRVVERLNRTRFSRWNKILPHFLFRKRMAEFLRVEYDFLSSSWYRGPL